MTASRRGVHSTYAMRSSAKGRDPVDLRQVESRACEPIISETSVKVSPRRAPAAPFGEAGLEPIAWLIIRG